MPFFNDGREKALHEYVLSQPRQQLQDNPAAVLAAIDTFVKTKTMMMILHEHKLKVVQGFLEAMNPQPKIIVELGTYVGNSAVALGAMLKENHAGESELSKVYTCELSADFAKIARDLIDLAGLASIVHVCEGPAAETLKRLHAEGSVTHTDVLVIDHWEKYYLSDLQVCEDLGLLRKGSMVIADNIDMPGTPDYVEYVRVGGRAGKVKYESNAYETTEEKGVPNVLEVSNVVSVA